MPRQPTLTYDRGTLILHPPPRGKAWVEFATWDDRIEKFRIPAHRYAELLTILHAEGTSLKDEARKFVALDLFTAPTEALEQGAEVDDRVHGNSSESTTPESTTPESRTNAVRPYGDVSNLPYPNQSQNQALGGRVSETVSETGGDRWSETLGRTPYPHQHEALLAWKQAQRRGVIVLPTGSGKSFVAQMAIASTPRSSLIVVPTLDLMHQWYAQLKTVFPAVEVGLLGGGSRDRTPILIATYDSAAIHAENLGNQYGLLIFDECHHLPSDFSRVIAEYSIAPYRLGLSATPERSDGRHTDLDHLIGPEVYRRNAEDLSGHTLAPYDVVPLKVQLTDEERHRYAQCIEQRNTFLRAARINFGSLDGWQRFVQASARSSAGRQAMLAHHEAKAIALGTDAKIRVLTDLLAQHYPAKTLIFTNDNATVYRISQSFLIPAITHQTPVKERHEILTHFREGDYKTLVVANVLDEGVDVPDASIAIFLAGSGSTRQFIQRLGRILRRGATPGKRAILYEVVAEDTVEENTSARRKGEPLKPRPPSSKRSAAPSNRSRLADRPLTLVPLPPIDDPLLYEVNPSMPLRAAEQQPDWDDDW